MSIIAPRAHYRCCPHCELDLRLHACPDGQKRTLTQQLQKAVAIAIADSHGELIAFARMDGVPLPSIVIAMNKAWTAARTGKPTQEVGERVKHPEKGHDISYYGDSRFVGWGGGVPVLRNGQIAGAVAVSGLSSAEDTALATLGADSIAKN